MNLNKSFLLPHKWQAVGGWTIVASILLSIMIIACDINGVFHVPAILGWIPFYIGLLLICISQEKVEDEYISELRSRLVCITVAVAFGVNILFIIANLLRICFGLFSSIAGIIGMLSSPTLFALIYIIALKLTLFGINRKVKRYDEQ